MGRIRASLRSLMTLGWGRKRGRCCRVEYSMQGRVKEMQARLKETNGLILTAAACRNNLRNAI